MFAVVKSGGKQYRVANDQKILVDKIDAKEGSIVTLKDILMLVDNGKIVDGKQLEKIAVSASVVKQTRGPKIITLKHRRRKNSRRLKGHRQDLTLLKVLGIGDPSKLVIKKEKSIKKEDNKKDPDKKKEVLDKNEDVTKKIVAKQKNETNKASEKKKVNVESKTKKVTSTKLKKTKN